MTELLLPVHGNMCVFGLKSFKFVLRGSAPRPWLVMQTHQAETRNPKPSGKMGETRNPDAAEKRNPKPKPGRNPVRGRFSRALARRSRASGVICRLAGGASDDICV